MAESWHELFMFIKSDFAKTQNLMFQVERLLRLKAARSSVEHIFDTNWDMLISHFVRVMDSCENSERSQFGFYIVLNSCNEYDASVNFLLRLASD